ncbi:ABC transporter ATP-binding protein [Curtobacterium ammoniigenes]|uniref:ABC transporter ATP-binding protein n=1 Tax=Curtobacterium ammoniigenes TaxID=395387 RepID=UPI000830BA38|nr:ABC transporter ATP-binding protein [Curtobacterium ammoniigenes]
MTITAPTTTGVDVVVSGLTKRYGATTALQDIDLDVRSGSFTVLLGPSGSGKSTLLRTLAGIESADEGTVRIGDRIVDDAGRTRVPPERRDLAMVFQDYALWPHMTVVQNVEYALRRRSLPGHERRERANEMLERVGLGGLAARYPNELSGGQQQRVALARSLVSRPGLLLFDEPLSNLDADLRERLRVEIATLTREIGATAVYITHDQGEAFALADEIVVLDHGTILQQGTAEDVFAEPADRTVARFTGTALECEGVVERSVAEHVTVRVNGCLVHGRARGPLQPGDRVHVVVRPNALGLVAASDGDNVLHGTVADVAFRGTRYDHVLATDVGILTGVAHPTGHARGSTQHVRIDPAGCFAFSA